MRTDVQAVEETVEIEERDAQPQTRGSQPVLRDPPAAKTPTDDELREVRRRHLAFKETGIGRDAGQRPAAGVVPLSLYPYLDVHRLRGAYPLCIFTDPACNIAPLTQVVDRALEGAALEGDDLERSRRWALQMEARIRQDASDESDHTLFKAWNSAAEEISAQYRDDQKKQKKLHHDLATIRKLIPSDARLVGCNQKTALDILSSRGAERGIPHFVRDDSSAQRRGTPAFARDDKNNPATRRANEGGVPRFARDDRSVRDVVRRLQDLLTLEDEESEAGLAPDHLKDSVGEGFQDDLDFTALSTLLHEASHGESLKPGRRRRIESIVEILTLHLHEIEMQSRSIQSLPESESVIRYVRKLIESQSLASRAWLAARLEIAGRFDEERHGALLTQDGAGLWGQTVSTLTPLPPIHLDFRQTISADDLANLAELFDREIPVRILVTSGTCIAGGEDDDSEPYLPASVGERLLLAGPLKGFLCQRSLADTVGLLEAITAFLQCDRTAVLVVYDGASFGDDRLHPYLKSAVGTESRAVPSFLYDSRRGPGWADRFSIDGNEQPDRTWPVTTVEITGVDGGADQRESSFNAAALTLCHPAFRDHFRLVDRDEWHDGMVAMEDYSGDPQQIPYVPAVSEEGVIHRVILSDHAWKQASRVGERWQSLRELGGINNSLAAKAVEKAAERLDDEHRARLSALEAEHRSVLEATTGKLAAEIVANIASGLLSEASMGPLPATPKPVAPPLPAIGTKEEDPSESAVEEGPIVAPVDDDMVILDEAYVETPRCTACDECTTINPRLFKYNENKQAYITDQSAGTFRELVIAAEKCPVRIIHPGKPLNPDEPHLDELMKRAEPFR